MYLECREMHVSTTKEFQRGHRSFLGPGDEETWCATNTHKPDGNWDQQTNQMLELFAQCGHPVFRGIGGSESKDEPLVTSQRTQKTLS